MSDVFKTTKPDIITIVLIVCFSVLWACNVSLKRDPALARPRKAYVYSNNTLLRVVDISKDQEVSLLGGRMLLEVKARRLRISRSDCPRKVCFHTGWIEKRGQTLVCVPNKIFVEFDKESPLFLDAVAN